MERMSQGKGKACQIAGIMENTVSNGDTGGLKRDQQLLAFILVNPLKSQSCCKVTPKNGSWLGCPWIAWMGWCRFGLWASLQTGLSFWQPLWAGVTPCQTPPESPECQSLEGWIQTATTTRVNVTKRAWKSSRRVFKWPVGCSKRAVDAMLLELGVLNHRGVATTACKACVRLSGVMIRVHSLFILLGMTDPSSTYVELWCRKVFFKMWDSLRWFYPIAVREDKNSHVGQWQ